LEWTEKGLIVNAFADTVSTLADVKVTLEE
jgi:hypothetical protein